MGKRDSGGYAQCVGNTGRRCNYTESFLIEEKNKKNSAKRESGAYAREIGNTGRKGNK